MNKEIIIEEQDETDFNKMPILAFTRDSLPDLFPLYASQIFKAILLFATEILRYGT